MCVFSTFVRVERGREGCRRRKSVLALLSGIQCRSFPGREEAVTRPLHAGRKGKWFKELDLKLLGMNVGKKFP